mmetsp:Transcript_34266/g.84302  ORF Transcript_34266/g.84302 Transcript_34266/m.84302 type:complete len:232 (+) Transcript_34266:433-1128(+)
MLSMPMMTTIMNIKMKKSPRESRFSRLGGSMSSTIRTRLTKLLPNVPKCSCFRAVRAVPNAQTKNPTTTRFLVTSSAISPNVYVRAARRVESTKTCSICAHRSTPAKAHSAMPTSCMLVRSGGAPSITSGGGGGGGPAPPPKGGGGGGVWRVFLRADPPTQWWGGGPPHEGGARGASLVCGAHLCTFVVNIIETYTHYTLIRVYIENLLSTHIHYTSEGAQRIFTTLEQHK